MIEFLTANLGTIIVITLLAVIVGAVIYRIIKNKKKGKSSCSCGCSGCPHSKACHTEDISD